MLLVTQTIFGTMLEGIMQEFEHQKEEIMWGHLGG